MYPSLKEQKFSELGKCKHIINFSLALDALENENVYSLKCHSPKLCARYFAHILLNNKQEFVDALSLLPMVYYIFFFRANPRFCIFCRFSFKL